MENVLDLASKIPQLSRPQPTGALELTALLEIGRTLAETPHLKHALRHLLELLASVNNMTRGFVLLADAETQELRVEACYGMNEEAARRVSYGKGEGLVGRVVESGKPVVVPQVSREPLLLRRLASADRSADGGVGGRGGGRELSFICLPVLIDRSPVGVLGVDLAYEEGRDFEQMTKFLSVAASMIAQALRLERYVEAERLRLLDENTHLKQELRERYDFGHIVGNSNPMRQVYEQVTQVARTNTTVLLRGESGTGKEMVAHAIHYNSLRAGKPFVKVNCAALPETLIESELFGYERGAFTGAMSRKKGRFELADGGTLFLDEIGDLNVSTQIKLLRALQEREFERLGSTETIKVNVRLVAATSKDLETAIEREQFRADLYYRLNVFTIFMPPLRERKPDVLLLADYFLDKYGREHGKHVKRISTPAIDMLTSYHWPGNVRELENIIERAVVVCDSNVIHGHHLPPTLQTAEGSGTISRLSLSASITAYERDLIMDALKTSRGNRAKAAKLLDTTERIISYKIKKYEIACDRFRP